MRALPILDRCNEDFGVMRGDTHARHCNRCGVRVQNLSAGTEEEAIALLSSTNNVPVCVRFAVERTGNIRFRAAVVGAVAMSIAASGVAMASSSMEGTSSPAAADAGVDANGDVEHWMGRK